MKTAGLALAVALFCAPAWAEEPAVEFEPPELSTAVAAKYALFAMIASNSYHKADRERFHVELLDWMQVEADGQAGDKPTYQGKSGLAYDIFENRKTGEYIFAFRGTDSKRDYLWANLAVPPLDIQYLSARKRFGEFLAAHPGSKVTLTGHSLGGGLALSMSVRYGVDAVVFDSSPRIFDGLGNKHLPANRVMIYESGEILAVVRKFWKNILRAVPRENIYKATFDFGGVSRHRSDFLARGLLNLGAGADASLVPVRDAPK